VTQPIKIQRPPTRRSDLRLTGTRFDRSNPDHPAGSDPANVATLLTMEGTRRGRHGDTALGDPFGSKRWPRS
jgi:hypothetical protein